MSKEQERVNYINSVCDNINKNMKAENEKAKKSLKEQFIEALDNYANTISKNIVELDSNIEVQEKTISILNEYLNGDQTLDKKIKDGVLDDITTKNEIVENAKKGMKILQHKLEIFKETKEFMVLNYDALVNVNFLFDNCLKFNGEYDKVISEF
jgi:aromatic ring-opening dioxygenase LigB subunit